MVVFEEKINQVKLCGTVCEKAPTLNESQSARCIMLTLKVEIVVGGGED